MTDSQETQLFELSKAELITALRKATKERDEALNKLRQLQESRGKYNRRKARRLAREMVARGEVA